MRWLCYNFSFSFRLPTFFSSNGWLKMQSTRRKGLFFWFFFFFFAFIYRRQNITECFIHEWLLFKIHHHIFPLPQKGKIKQTLVIQLWSCEEMNEIVLVSTKTLSSMNVDVCTAKRICWMEWAMHVQRMCENIHWNASISAFFLS